jgi:N-acetylmuramoyl-L-alanine amidase
VRAGLLSWFLTVFLLTPGAAAEAVTRVLDVRVGAGPSGTRLVIDSNKQLNYRVFSLSAGAERIIIDLPKLRWSIGGLTAESGSGPGEGLISGFRYAHNAADSSRMVLDLSGPAEVTRELALEPRHRLWWRAGFATLRFTALLTSEPFPLATTTW